MFLYTNKKKTTFLKHRRFLETVNSNMHGTMGMEGQRPSGLIITLLENEES